MYGRKSATRTNNAKHSSSHVKSEPNVLFIKKKGTSRTAPKEFHPQSTRLELAQPLLLHDSYKVPRGSTVLVKVPRLLITGDYRMPSRFWTKLDGNLANPISDTEIRVRNGEYVKATDFITAKVLRNLMKMCGTNKENLYLCLVTLAKYGMERQKAMVEISKRNEERRKVSYKYRSMLESGADEEEARVGAQHAMEAFGQFLIAAMPMLRGEMRSRRLAWTGWNRYDEREDHRSCQGAEAAGGRTGGELLEEGGGLGVGAAEGDLARFVKT